MNTVVLIIYLSKQNGNNMRKSLFATAAATDA